MIESRVRARAWWEDLQDSLWLLPAIGVIVAILLARVMVALEPMPEWLPRWLGFVGGADGARSLLAQLAGATFTVLGVVFSLTIVALQMASAQFTPRLLRTFLKDRSVQVVLSGLVSSGVFHVAVLRHVRSLDEREPFVPELAVTVALMAALGAVALLVYFFHHLTRQLRVEVVMVSIRRESLHQLRGLRTQPDELPDQRPPDPPPSAVVVASESSGYLQKLDLPALVSAAVRHGIVLRLRPSLG